MWSLSELFGYVSQEGCLVTICVDLKEDRHSVPMIVHLPARIALPIQKVVGRTRVKILDANGIVWKLCVDGLSMQNAHKQTKPHIQMPLGENIVKLCDSVLDICRHTLLRVDGILALEDESQVKCPNPKRFLWWSPIPRFFEDMHGNVRPLKSKEQESYPLLDEFTSKHTNILLIRDDGHLLFCLDESNHVHVMKKDAGITWNLHDNIVDIQVLNMHGTLLRTSDDEYIFVDQDLRLTPVDTLSGEVVIFCNGVHFADAKGFMLNERGEFLFYKVHGKKFHLLSREVITEESHRPNVKFYKEMMFKRHGYLPPMSSGCRKPPRKSE